MAKQEKMCWICAVDIDSFNYIPQHVAVKDAIQEGYVCYETYEECMKACDHQNSL